MPRPSSQWDRIAASAGFRELLAAKARFIVPATVFFLLYYFLLPLLVGYAPTMMSVPILGPLNGAYLFALSQFAMAGVVTWLYLGAASRFDRKAAEVLREDRKHGGEGEN